MRWVIRPAGPLRGAVRVPGDKSIAHRWLILAATARGTTSITGLPASLDVRSTATCLAAMAPSARPALEVWGVNTPVAVEGGGSTWNAAEDRGTTGVLEVEGEGRAGLRATVDRLECGNSGTTMRLLCGVLAGCSFDSVLTGDPSLSARPMERVAAPLRAMGATVRTVDGHAPLSIEGRPLHGARHVLPVPSAQVKGALLFAGLAAEGETAVVEPAPTRDHTERALEALGAPVSRGEAIAVRAFQHEGFAGSVPGDPSSAAFLIAAAALTGSAVRIDDVGLNPTRLRFLEVMARMGVRTRAEVEHHEVGEPVGSIEVEPAAGIQPVRVEADEIPLVIDELPVLAVMAAHAPAESWFLGAGELRVKESDRLAALTVGIRAAGGHAADEGDDLVVAGGGLAGGAVDAGADHRIAMAFAVGGLAARGTTEIRGAEVADVSFPGFVDVVHAMGADVEERP